MNDPAHSPLRLQHLAASERPQERLEKFGPAALSDAELLAVLLRTGSARHNVLQLAHQLIAEAGSLAAMARWGQADFRRFLGIGRVKALQLVTVMQIASRVLAQSAAVADVFNRPEKIHEHFRLQVIGLAVEKFWVLCLNRKNRLLRQVEISSGTATSSLAHPREVFREAIRQGATAVVCVHNHPSGDPAPSAADVQVTRQLRDAGRAIDIDLLDHLIIGHPSADPQGRGYYSFREAGLI